jgi:isoleucyl-tRNA synthetase
MVGENANFDELDIKNKLQRTLNPLWNSYKFFETYATANNWTTEDTVTSDYILDTWIKLRLDQVIKSVVQNLEGYTTPPAVRSLEEFVDDLSRWYVRRSRDRISGGDSGALSTLYQVLVHFTHAVAPIIPFLAESIYKGLQQFDPSLKEESIHLRSYTDFSFSADNQQKILDGMETAKKIASQALSARTESGIAVRQPLAKITVSGVVPLSKEYAQLIKEEVNVKAVDWIESDAKDFKVVLDTNLTDELKTEGVARELVRAIQDLRKEKGLTVSQKVKVTYPNTPENTKAVQVFGDEIKQKVGATELLSGDALTLIY